MQQFNSNQELMRTLIKENCIRKGDFTLRSGQQTDVFVDLQAISYTEPFLTLYVLLLEDMVKDLEFDRFWGVPTGGNPLAAAAKKNIPNQRTFLYVPPNRDSSITNTTNVTSAQGVTLSSRPNIIAGVIEKTD